uniref:Uncharacterized protein n=1 Tax=Cannabis sativa TaxID=3483 RepID=A0A803RA59_CANSA
MNEKHVCVCVYTIKLSCVFYPYDLTWIITTFLNVLLIYWLLVQDRPSTKVHAAPGGGSSLGYLFGDGGGN